MTRVGQVGWIPKQRFSVRHVGPDHETDFAPMFITESAGEGLAKNPKPNRIKGLLQGKEQKVGHIAPGKLILSKRRPCVQPIQNFIGKPPSIGRVGHDEKGTNTEENAKSKPRPTL